MNDQPYTMIACEDNMDFVGNLSDDRMKLIVTSPPYNLGKPYEKRTSLDVWLSAQEQVIRECVRVLHPQGSLCWQVGNYVQNNEIIPLDMILYPVFRQFGLKLRNRIIWHFGHGLHCANGYQEDMKLSSGGLKTMIILGIWIRFVSPLNTQGNGISRDRMLGSCQGTLRERTQVMCGCSLM